MNRWIGWTVLLATLLVVGCSSEAERGRNRDRGQPRSAPDTEVEKKVDKEKK